MKNWKTTVLGYIAGFLPIVVKVLSKQPIEGSDIAAAAGVIGLGHAAADSATNIK